MPLVSLTHRAAFHCTGWTIEINTDTLHIMRDPPNAAMVVTENEARDLQVLLGAALAWWEGRELGQEIDVATAVGRSVAGALS